VVAEACRAQYFSDHLADENDFLELTPEAARRCRRFSLRMNKAEGKRTDLVVSSDYVDGRPTLYDLGIKKEQSVRLQCMALA
jgi:hypothetical protein